MNLVHAESVIDVGCGTGTWLAVFREHGARTILGVDGIWIERETLEIPPENFKTHDLATPLRLDRTFDLVVCLEVAEHLPSASANGLVESLTRLGSVILFSAGIPCQGGTHHLNEQWPGYWATKFEERGYVTVDLIRPKVWNNESVAVWYAQNALLFVKRDVLQLNAAIGDEWDGGSHTVLSVVHPRQYLSVADPWKLTPGQLVRSFPKTVSALLRKTIFRTIRGR